MIRMRSPVRLLQNIWFCEAKEEHEGIDLTKEYTKPVKKRMRVSWTMGYVRGNPIGWDLLYDRYADNYDRNFKPVEGTFCFVDIEPVLDNDGNLATEDIPELNLDGTPKLDGDGNPITHKQYLTEPDYYIHRIFGTKRGVISRLVLSRT